VFPAAGVGDGTTAGLLTGVGPARERRIGPSSGEGVGFTASSGVRTEFTAPGLASAVGEVDGRMTIRGVAVAPSEDELTAGDSAGSGEGPVLSRSWDRLAR